MGSTCSGLCALHCEPPEPGVCVLCRRTLRDGEGRRSSRTFCPECARRRLDAAKTRYANDHRPRRRAIVVGGVQI